MCAAKLYWPTSARQPKLDELQEQLETDPATLDPTRPTVAEAEAATGDTLASPEMNMLHQAERCLESALTMMLQKDSEQRAVNARNNGSGQASHQNVGVQNKRVSTIFCFNISPSCPPFEHYPTSCRC